jgi:hypothetical protein
MGRAREAIAARMNQLSGIFFNMKTGKFAG